MTASFFSILIQFAYLVFHPSNGNLTGWNCQRFCICMMLRESETIFSQENGWILINMSIDNFFLFVNSFQIKKLCLIALNLYLIGGKRHFSHLRMALLDVVTLLFPKLLTSFLRSRSHRTLFSSESYSINFWQKLVACIGTLIGWNWHKVWFVLVFLFSQTHCPLKLPAAFSSIKVSPDSFKNSEGGSKMYLGFILRRPDKFIIPTNAESIGGNDVCGKYVKIRFNTLSSFFV